MAIKTITWTVGDDRKVSPTAVQEAGVQGDHHATQVEFVVPKAWQTGYALYIEAVSSAGSYDKTDALTLADGKVSFLVPLAWTQDGGRSVLRLVATEQDPAEGAEPVTLYSRDGRVNFADRQTGFARVQTLITGAIHRLMEWAKKAVEVSAASAQKMQETAENFEQYVADSKAEGNKIIETIKTDYRDEITEFEAAQERAFNTWFELVKGQLSDDVAGNLQNQIICNGERITLLAYMTQNNDYVVPITTDDGDSTAILVDDLGNAILANWKYKEV